MSTVSTDTDTSFFIAVSGNDSVPGIYGIGTSAASAIKDAWEWANRAPLEKPYLDYSEDHGLRMWHLANADGEEARFHSEQDAYEAYGRLGYVARQCTERLYRHIEEHGCDANRFRWTRDASGLDDMLAEEDA